MQVRRSTNVPPYEVMKDTQGSSAVQELETDPSESASRSLEREPSSVPWGVKARPALVVRIPRGYVWLFATGLLAIVVLAYWIGSSRGYRLAKREISSLEHWMTDHPSDTPLVTGTTPGGAMVTYAPGPSGHTELRQPGLHYFVLADYPKTEARRLVQFLRENRVDSAAYGAHNGGLMRVVALRGLNADQLTNEARRQFEQQLRTLGRRWKDLHRGASDLADLQLQRYQ